MEEDELDDLDDLLDTMPGRGSNGAEVRSVPVESPSHPGISFTFPGWGIDIHKTAVVRHSAGGSRDFSAAIERFKRRGSASLPVPISGSPVSEVFDEVLLRVFSFLELTDLSASRQVCKKWYSICSSDCLWEKFLTAKASNSSKLPRWLEVKHSVTSFRISSRYTYSKKGYEIFLDASDAWWQAGQPHGKYTSSVLCPLIRKVTLSDWCVFYEVLSAVFAKRADTIAVELQNLYQNDCSDPSDKETSEEDGVAGVKIWCRLCKLWNRYIDWIKLVSLHCADLNYAVRLERVRTVGTPTLYDKGVLCFRSQVILSYGLRRLLEAGLLRLSTRETEGSATEDEVELLCLSHHLLQMLDVSDDFMLPVDCLTQAKFRRCFLDGESAKDFFRSQIKASRKENF